MPKTPVLSYQEAQVLVESVKSQDPNMVMRFFFRAADGGPGNPFIFDHNISPPWQRKFCFARTPNVLVVGGFGSGKTQTALWAMVYHAMTVDGFVGLYVAPETAQGNEILQFFQERFLGSYAEKRGLIRVLKSPPYRLIFQYWVPRKDGNRLHMARITILNADRDGRGILSFEGDWVHLEEAFSYPAETLKKIVRNVGSRARGRTASGRPRMGRLSMTTNWFENVYGNYLINQARANPKRWLLIFVSSFSNYNLTDEHLARLMENMSEEDIERFLNAREPQHDPPYFSREGIQNMFDADDLDMIMDGLRKRGKVAESADLGVYEYMMPVEENATYVMSVDWGRGSAPDRNAPVFSVFKVENPARLVGFWWGEGKNLSSLLSKMARFIKHFRPVAVLFDATGPSSTIAQLVEGRLIADYGIEYLNLIPVDFTRTKPGMLMTLQTMMEKGFIKVPSDLIGARVQFFRYPGPEDDKKEAQDIVMSFAMAAAFLWQNLGFDEEEVDDEYRIEALPLPEQVAKLRNPADVLRAGAWPEAEGTWDFPKPVPAVDLVRSYERFEKKRDDDFLWPW